MKTKVKRTTQDDAREKEQIRIFKLKGTEGRSNKYIHDGNFKEEELTQILKNINLELKTCDVSRGSVTTCRDLSLEKLEIYGKCWWIVSVYRKKDNQAGFEFTGEHYAFHGKDPEKWIERQKKNITQGTIKYAGLEDWNRCLKILEENNFDTDKLKKLDHTFKKGCARNDPPIQLNYVKKIGIKIDPNRPAEHLREIILEREKKKKKLLTSRK